MIEGGPSNLLINKKTAISIRVYEPSGREFESLRARHKIKGLADCRCWPFSFCRHFADTSVRPLAD